MTGPASGPTRTQAPRLHLTCPRCGLTIMPRADWLTIEHCPRCLARAQLAVPMFGSRLPPGELYAAGSAPTDPHSARRRSRRRSPICGPLPEALSAAASGVSDAAAGGRRTAR